MRVYSFFNRLHGDLVSSLLRQWLLVESPMVVLIDGEANEEERRMLISGSGPSLTYDDQGQAFYVDANGKRLFDGKNPKKALALKPDEIPALGFGSVADIKAYHLITGYSDELAKIVYSIGFCTRLTDGSFAYQTKVLDEKSPLLCYVSEDLRHPEYSRLFPCDRDTHTQERHSRDFLLLKYMTLEIEAAGGLTRDPLENRTRLADFSPKALAWMNGENGRKIFFETLQQARLEKLLHHAAYGEQEEMVKMIRDDITLLECTKKAPVQLCALEVICPEISFLDLVALFKDWFYGRAIVEVINQSDLTKEEKQAYKDNFSIRLKAVKKYGVEALLDNLLNKGVQILDGDSLSEDDLRRYQADVVERNAYHLIIKNGKDISVVLGYRDPKTGQYAQKEILEDHELFKVAALELYKKLKTPRFRCYFTRTNRDLTLVREELKALGVETQIKMRLKRNNFENLLNYFEKGIHGWEKENWTLNRVHEQWHGEICAELRLFKPLEWELWLSDKNPLTFYKDENEAFVNSARRANGDKNYRDTSFLPLSSSFGNRFISLRYGLARHGEWAACFLQSILKVEQQEWKNFKRSLLADENLRLSQ